MEKQITYVDNGAHNISLKPAEPEHEEFLFRVFKETRPDLMYIYNISKDEGDKIIHQQFIIEQQQLMNMYPNAEFKVIIFKEELIGRLYINYGQESQHIIELGILEKYREMGIGKKVMTNIIEEAVQEGKNITLKAAWYNSFAIFLFKKLGFELIKNGEVFYDMQYKYDHV
jgi:ribosomal protein S18 acetylase RimI-like enzyme